MADLLHPTVPDLEDAPETPDDPGDFELAVSAEDQMEAQLLVSACEEAGIQVILRSQRSGLVGALVSPVEGIDILVPRQDLEPAGRSPGGSKPVVPAGTAGAGP